MANLLIVDDNPDICNLLTLVFERAGHKVKSVFCGEEALTLCKDYIPEIVILDVEMPGHKDGFEICRLLLAEPQLEHVPVLFVSSHNDVEYRLKGYEAGASDYLCKPVDPNELLSKIDLNLTHKNEWEQASTKASSATEAAMAAMRTNSELGLVMRFMSDIVSIYSFEKLAEAAVDFLSACGLKSSIQLRWKHLVENSGHSSSLSPLETALLDRGSDADRIATFGSKVMVNAPYASILIKNMWEDKEQRGRFLDHLASVIEALNARVEALGVMAESQHRSRQLESHTGELESLFVDLDAYINSFSKGLHGMLDGLENQLEDLVLNLKLNRGQEEELRDMMSDARSSLEDLSQQGDEFDIRCSRMESSFRELMH